MSEEEPNLSVCMQKLKIMPRPRPVKIYRDEELPLKLNPFARKHKSKSQPYGALFGPGCACRRRRSARIPPVKRPPSKLLRDPIIVLLDKCPHAPTRRKKPKDNTAPAASAKSDSTSRDADETPHQRLSVQGTALEGRLFGENTTQQDFKSIIAGCEQLSLSNCELEFAAPNFRETRGSHGQGSAGRGGEKPQTMGSSSCSQQAMARLCLNPPCDVTIDELASYFETFVHIPKKMSSMAEMMYI